MDKRREPRGFTLIELLVVMGIMAVLGVLTTVGYYGIAKDAKLASAKNTVAAVLDNARALAMKNNRIVLVAFRPRMDGTSEQYLEAVMCQFSGDSGRVSVSGSWQVVDRFVPIPGTPTRRLPTGIFVAGPRFGEDTDFDWAIPSYLPAVNPTTGLGEINGQMMGVMFAPDGTAVSRNTATDSARLYVDMNQDGLQQIKGGSIDILALPVILPADFNGDNDIPRTHDGNFEQEYENDEPYISVVGFLAVIDNTDVRELYDPNQWLDTVGTGYQTRRINYSQYINDNADPIYFNRYTGVAMK